MATVTTAAHARVRAPGHPDRHRARPASGWRCWPPRSGRPRWWMGQRMLDGSDEPLGLLALAALAVLLWHCRGRLRAAPRLGWLALALAGAVASTRAAGAGAAAACHRCSGCWRWARAWPPSCRRRVATAPVLGLSLLSLPLLASLQFYAGYPLRVVTAEASRWLLAAGFSAQRSGASLLVDGQLVIVDAPCSGVQMLWLGYFTACVVALHAGRRDARLPGAAAGGQPAGAGRQRAAQHACWSPSRRRASTSPAGPTRRWAWPCWPRSAPPSPGSCMQRQEAAMFDNSFLNRVLFKSLCALLLPACMVWGAFASWARPPRAGSARHARLRIAGAMAGPAAAAAGAVRGRAALRPAVSRHPGAHDRRPAGAGAARGASGPPACCIRRPTATAAWVTASPAQQLTARCATAAVALLRSRARGPAPARVRAHRRCARHRLHRRLGLVLGGRCWASRRARGKPSPLRGRCEDLRCWICCCPAARRRGARCRQPSMPRRAVLAPLPGEWSVPLRCRPVRTAGRRAVADPPGHLALGRPAARWPRSAHPRRPAARCNGRPPAARCCCAARPASCSRPGWDRTACRSPQAQVTARRQGELLSGEVVAGRVRGTWRGEVAQSQLRLQLSIPATPLADGYALFAQHIPELAQARIAGSFALQAQLSLPSGSLHRRAVHRRLRGDRPGHRGPGRRAHQLQPRPARQPAAARELAGARRDRGRGPALLGPPGLRPGRTRRVGRPQPARPSASSAAPAPCRSRWPSC